MMVEYNRTVSQFLRMYRYRRFIGIYGIPTGNVDAHPLIIYSIVRSSLL
jgi:hypothetical protein